MFPYLILGIAILIGFVLLSRWFVTADPKAVVKALKWSAGILGALVIFYIIVARQFSLLLWALLFLLPFFMRMSALRNRVKAAFGPTPGQTSEVNTRYLRMILDHDSGEMDGEVLEGQFKGARLRELGLPELRALWEECRAGDAQSAALLEAYLDRVAGETWRDGTEGGGAGAADRGPDSPMTRQEALEILGLEPDAGRQEIIEAHRRLLQKVHPDKGGSNFLAAKINAAKDLLLGD